MLKPSDQEEKYFQEQELKRRLKAAEEAQKRITAEERRRLKELHHMHCPKCGQKLVTERYGENTDVDVCPGCRGLWLDAGELEGILASAKKSGPLRAFLRILGG